MTHLELASAKHQDKEVTFQDASIDIWDKKYRLKDKNGNPVDTDMDSTVQYPLDVLPQTLVPRSINPPHQLLIVRYRALSLIP